MPTLRRKKFAPDELVVALVGFAADVPPHFSCPAGTRLRGDHAAVLANSQYFISAAEPDDKVAAARHGLGAR